MKAVGKESHMERTANEPRNAQMHVVTLGSSRQVNDNIKVFRSRIPDGSSIEFLPGQWLDTFVPGVAKPGGFTITSTPSKARLLTSPYIELAVQNSPSNPPAAWLWNSTSFGAHLLVRVGGAFVWPAPGIDLVSLRRVVLVAGGVGINPLMSILEYLVETACSLEIQLLYSIKTPETVDPSKILFLERLVSIYGCRQG
ncbi:Oxidoreductase NAD-binding domain-containing protein 1 [Colletotrichum sidae]|uniref:Oxidoreductase NAD-binding domain-containing protein 1 n=1 Tax=Colletotrichum sidae TaxID=1347389 RepID=A0A4V3I1I0_9PEZI|nr:Oxidoreductase NAD-binding domain-containing protein 1 [Colletotrichum sidae]